MSLRWYFFLFMALLVAVVAVYFNALHMDFIGDDLGRIVHEPALRGSFTRTITHLLPDRPILVASLWLNYQLGALDPFSYKIVNLLLHAGVGFLFVLFLTELFSKSAWLWYLLAAALFLVHPLNNQAVNSVSQRGVLLCALFSLAALILHLRNFKNPLRHRSLLIFLFVVLAILSKSNAIALPFLLWASSIWLDKKRPLTALKQTAAYFFPLVLPIYFYFFLHINSQQESMPWLKYFILQWGLIWFYVKLMILPTHLHFIYDIHLFPSWLISFTALLAHLFVLGVIVWCWRRNSRTLGFFLTATYITLMPESGLFPILHVFFEHRAYIPFLFVIGSVISVVHLNSKPLTPWRRPLGVTALAGFATFAVMNVSYNQKINTFEKWSFYNFEQNPNDWGLNMSQMHTLALYPTPWGNEFANRVVASDPNNELYQIYRAMIQYPEATEDKKKSFLDKLAGFLASDKPVPQGARVHFNRFWRVKSEELYPSDIYLERLETFLAIQLPALKKNPYFEPLVQLHKDSTLKLASLYFEKAPSEQWRFLRILLVLEKEYSIQNEKFQEQMNTLKKSLSQDPKAQEVLKIFSNSTL